MKNQKGFGAIEGLLILVIVGIMGFTGWFVFNSRNKTDNTLDTTSKTSAANPVAKTVTKDTAATNKLSQDPAASFAQSFYEQYIKADTKDARDNLVNKYGTENSIPEYEDAIGADPIVCAQNMPTSVSSSESTTADSRISVTVHETFGDGVHDIKVQVVKFPDGYHLDLVTCPQN